MRDAILAALMALVGSCTPQRAVQLPTALGLTPLLAPPGGESDAIETLVDGRVESRGWYCSHAPMPQRYALMLASSGPRQIAAVGLVPGNVGPDGVGEVTVRVHEGYGISAPGREFVGRVGGREGSLQLLRLPSPVRGDHVTIRLAQRSRLATAVCLAEIAAYDATTGLPAGPDVTTVVLAPALDTAAGAPPSRHATAAGPPDAALADATGSEPVVSRDDAAVHMATDASAPGERGD